MLSGFASIVTNTVLNYAFIFGKLGCPAMGVKGAALATVISAAVSKGHEHAFSYGNASACGRQASRVAAAGKGLCGAV